MLCAASLSEVGKAKTERENKVHVANFTSPNNRPLTHHQRHENGNTGPAERAFARRETPQLPTSPRGVISTHVS